MPFSIPNKKAAAVVIFMSAPPICNIPINVKRICATKIIIAPIIDESIFSVEKHINDNIKISTGTKSPTILVLMSNIEAYISTNSSTSPCIKNIPVSYLQNKAEAYTMVQATIIPTAYLLKPFFVFMKFTTISLCFCSIFQFPLVFAIILQYRCIVKRFI